MYSYYYIFGLNKLFSKIPRRSLYPSLIAFLCMTSSNKEHTHVPESPKQHPFDIKNNNPTTSMVVPELP